MSRRLSRPACGWRARRSARALSPRRCRMTVSSSPPRADPQAFALLYRRYVHDLYRYLYHRVGNQQVAEDLTASTFGKALAGIGRYHEQGSFPAWLFSPPPPPLQGSQPPPPPWGGGRICRGGGGGPGPPPRVA